MSRQTRNGSRDWPARTVVRAAAGVLAIAAGFAAAGARAQDPSEPPAQATAAARPTNLEPTPAQASPAPPGTAVAGPGANAGGPALAPPGVALLEPDVQVVRFQGPLGLTVEVLSPAPMPVPAGDGGGIITVGLKRGVGYRLRLSGIPERPGRELYPVIEIVGHLHRPEGIDPGKYPIRVVFNQDDLDDTGEKSRLVTKIIYLEDPDQAIPFHLPKDQITALTLNPTESPLQVAQALGRPVAIVRMGVRTPTVEEIQAGAAGDVGLDWALSIGSGPCPFLTSSGTKCGLPCGPVCTPAPRPKQPSLPRDEYLCDGGDRGTPAAAGRSGSVGGIDPRDTVVGFNIGIKGRVEPRVLPTNIVCIYAPRFAEVRVSTGPNQTVDVQHVNTDKRVNKGVQLDGNAWAKKLVQNQDAQLMRDRSRAMGLKGRFFPDEKSNNRGVSAMKGDVMTITNLQLQNSELASNRQNPALLKVKIRLDGIKTAEGPVVTGIAESANEAVRVWAPHQMTGVEVPPDRPGLAVIKRVSAAEAEPGDTVSYVIFYRNMGNTPISNVSIVDSLLPRLEYVKGTSRGPEGTAFSAAMNRVGSTELRWVLPAPLPPGSVGHVSFDAIVR
jgi:uncharacterized repeat protein (TIGR01451 family)